MSTKAVEYDEIHALLQSHRFEVEIGNTKYGFKRVTGLKRVSQLEPLMVGGMNDGPVMLRAAVKDTGRLVMERGKRYAGQALCFVPGQILANGMSIRLYDDFGRVKAAYTVTKPILEWISYSALDASQGAVFIETLSIAHHGISESGGNA